MGCNDLLQLLNNDWLNTSDHIAISSRIAFHLRTCSLCYHGIIELAEDLLAGDVLTCGECRERFPNYYEVAHPDHPLIEMAEVEIAEVVIHLGRCVDCNEEYKELVNLSELEERSAL